LSPWKHLLNQIFSDAKTAPEEIFFPSEKPEGPLERIHAMRSIKSGSGFARLYGAKDIAQFRRQIEYMRDFEDSYARTNIPFSEPMPTYADMSVAQLRCYFTWRTGARRDEWEDIPFSYALLYVFELLNSPDAAADLARVWLALREFHPRLDARMQRWFKDYYICYGSETPFQEYVRRLGMAEFYPQNARRRSMLSLSSYDYRASRFFRENPALLPVLEQALHAALLNLGPLFTLYGLNPEGLFYPQPARFVHYEPFVEAAVLPPETQTSETPGENREVRLSREEIYRLRSGVWSCARENAFCPPSHGMGYLVKRIEAVMRTCAGFALPWNADPRPLLERWIHSGSVEMELFNFLEDDRFDLLLRDTVQAVFACALPEGALVSVAKTLAAELETEPLRTILRLREVPGTGARQFKKQARLLADLSDTCEETAPFAAKTPDYAMMTPPELRTYLTWRTRLRAGDLRRTETAYALLYCFELLSGIEKEPFPKLCRFLAAYGPLDRTIAKKLPGWLRDHFVTHPQALGYDFPALLQRYGLECYFPTLFLFREGPQLPLFQQFASYSLAKSRFYWEDCTALFGDCFEQVLEAARAAFRAQRMDLRRAFLEPPRPDEAWEPFQGIPVSFPGSRQSRTVTFSCGHSAEEKYIYDGREWRCAAKTELTPHAGALAGFLIKRMEMRLRQAVRFHYPLTAAPAQMLGKALPPRGKLRDLLCSEEFTRAIDKAVEDFAQAHDLSRLRGQAAAGRRRAPLPSEASSMVPAPPPPPVKVDFAKLPEIRAQAREMTERLIVEDNAECLMLNAELAAPQPVISADNLRDALTIAQAAVVDYLCTGGGAPPPMDELALEAINEIALDVLGDTLIDINDDVPVVHGEYAVKWKEGAL